MAEQAEIEALIITLRDSGEWWRATEELAKIGKPAVNLLCQALLKQDFNVPEGQYYDDYWRAYVAEVLGEIADPSSAEALITALTDVNINVRVWSAMALARIGDRRAVEPIRQAYIATDDEDARYNIAEALADFGISIEE